MSLFKLTEVRPDYLPLLCHPEKPLSPSQHPPVPSSMLIMANFCLVSSFFLSRPPLLLPCLTLPPPWLYTPIHATLYGPAPPLLTLLFFSFSALHKPIQAPLYGTLPHSSISVQTYIYILKHGVWITVCRLT